MKSARRRLMFLISGILRRRFSSLISKNFNFQQFESSKNPLFKKSALKNADEQPDSKSKKKLFQRRGTGYPGADGFSEKNRRKFSVIGNLKNFSSESEQSEDEFAQSHPKNFNSTPIFQEKSQKKQKQKVFFDEKIEEVPQCRISKVQK